MDLLNTVMFNADSRKIDWKAIDKIECGINVQRCEKWWQAVASVALLFWPAARQSIGASRWSVEVCGVVWMSSNVSCSETSEMHGRSLTAMMTNLKCLIKFSADKKCCLLEHTNVSSVNQ